MNEVQLLEMLYSERFPKREMPAFFVVRAEIDGEASEANGYTSTGEYRLPVYRNTIYVMICDPESRERVERPMTEADKITYRRAWDAFERIRNLTPIHYLPRMTPADAETCRSAGIHWVEQMADADPHQIREDLRRWIPVANAYLGRKLRIRVASDEAA